MKTQFVHAVLPSGQAIWRKKIKRHTMVTAGMIINDKVIIAKILTYNKKQAHQLWEILNQSIAKKFVCGMAHLREIQLHKEGKVSTLEEINIID